MLMTNLDRWPCKLAAVIAVSVGCVLPIVDVGATAVPRLARL